MGLFSHQHDDEREATRHREAQQRLADARDRQQGRHASSGAYPETSWRKEFELHVVKRGDTLATIARQVYGDTNQWHRIQQANPIVLKNPELVHPGLVLRIPKGDGKPLA